MNWRTALSYFLGLAALIGLAVMGPAPARGDDCVPLVAFQHGLASSRVFANLRRVPIENLKQAVEIYNSLPGTGNDQQWDLVLLLDRINGGGLVLVGKGEEICFWREFTDYQWGPLKRLLEGTRA